MALRAGGFLLRRKLHSQWLGWLRLAIPRCILLRRWAYACAFVFAAAGFGRRCVGAGTGQGTVEIDGRHDRFLERHGVFRALVFALLLERAAKDLTFYTAGNRCVR